MKITASEMQDLIKYDMIDDITIANLIDEMKKKKRSEYEQKVEEVHPYSIKPIELTKHGKKEIYYQTQAPWRKNQKLRIKDRSHFYDELAKHYGILEPSSTVANVYEMAILNKIAEKRPSANTIKKNRENYTRFIDESFASRDITGITASDLNKYTQDMIERLNATKYPPEYKGFMNYKGILNLIFDYALRQKIIVSNPVPEMLSNDIFEKQLVKKNHDPDKTETDIFTQDELSQIIDTINTKKNEPMYQRMDGYYVNGYAIKLSIVTGMRIAELCALKWEDVRDKYIWIHRQQLIERTANGSKNIQYDVNWTKNEKKREGKGRKFPLFENVRNVLNEIKEEQSKLGIKTEYVLSHRDGRPLNKESYGKFLTKFCRSLGFEVTNNHAFRKSLNSLVFVPKGIGVAERAAMLGHSIETNLKYYTKAPKDYVDDLLEKFDSESPGHLSGTQIIDFEQKKRSLKSL